jgi:hypothetical protein
MMTPAVPVTAAFGSIGPYTLSADHAALPRVDSYNHLGRRLDDDERVRLIFLVGADRQKPTAESSESMSVRWNSLSRLFASHSSPSSALATSSPPRMNDLTSHRSSIVSTTSRGQLTIVSSTFMSGGTAMPMRSNRC